MSVALVALWLAAAQGAVRPASPPAPAAASTESDEQRLAKVRQRREALEQELQRMRGEEKSLLGEVERLELELSLRSEELAELQIALKRTRAQLDATVARVAVLEKSLAEARPALKRHALWVLLVLGNLLGFIGGTVCGNLADLDKPYYHFVYITALSFVLSPLKPRLLHQGQSVVCQLHRIGRSVDHLPKRRGRQQRR